LFEQLSEFDSVSNTKVTGHPHEAFISPTGIARICRFLLKPPKLLFQAGLALPGLLRFRTCRIAIRRHVGQNCFMASLDIRHLHSVPAKAKQNTECHDADH